MIKIFSNFFIFLFLLFSLNSCSTISDTVDLAGIVDKTENFLFGKDEEEEQKEELQENNNVNEQELVEEELDISDIPLEKPEFSDIEKDFFEGEQSAEIQIEESNDPKEEPLIEKKEQLSSEQKNIEVISKIAQNVRMRVRMLLLNSDPPTAVDGSEISYQKQEKRTDFNYKEDDKIAVFFFPNNSVIPDKQAENVINEIVKFYSENTLILVGHASSTGGETTEGKKINMELSFGRAEAIKNMLINKGFPSEKVNVLGKGDLEPTVKANSNNNDSDDRRVEVYLFSK